MLICGTDHNLILTDEDVLYVCGWNKYGQLGIGNFQDQREFIPTGDITDIDH